MKQLGGPDVLLFDPTRASNESEAPDLIVVFGWMNAAPSLLMKYVKGHQSLFPESSIAAVKIDTPFLLAGREKRERTLAPLASLILDKIYYSNTPTRGILFHIISNGGGFQLLYLSDLLSRSIARRAPVSTSPPIGFIFDSIPGEGEYASMLKTFIASAGIQSPVAKAILPAPIALLHLAYLGMTTIRGMPALLPLLRARLLEAELVPTADRNTPRTYVYSDVDTMVAYTSVEAHLKEMEKRGLSFDKEKYSGSQHVSHMKQDTERYWGAVRQVWEKAKRVASERHSYKAKL